MGILDRLTRSARDRFAKEALRLAQRAAGVAEARYDRERFAIMMRRHDAEAPAWIYLSNVYSESFGAPRAERRERVERLIRVMTTSHGTDPWESVRPRLRPVLRPVTFGQVGVAGMVPPISRPALPYLCEFVVVDTPESMAYVVPGRLEAWGVTADEVFAAARANLESIARASRGWPEGERRALIRMVDTGDAYFTSLLLAPGWLAEASERCGAPVVAFAPDSNTLVLCDVQPGALARVYALIEEEYGEAVRSLSPVGYVADAVGNVVPYAPAEDDPDRAAACRAEMLLATTEYGAQAQWLGKEYDQAGIEVYVGPLLAASRPDAAPITIATWTDGITSLLPRTQYISFVSGGRTPSGSGNSPLVPWHAVAEVIDLRPEPLLSPVRYRVGGWPPPDVLAGLLDQAIG